MDDEAFRRLVYWVKERHQIYLKRCMGLSKPWTKDWILQTRKFCNVIRAKDKVSRWLLDNWYLPNKDHPNMLVAACLARHLNRIDSLEACGFPEVWDPQSIVTVLEDRRARGLKNYSHAYMITGNYGPRGREPQTKVQQTVFIVCDPLHRSGLRLDTSSMRGSWELLCRMKGFSSFMAGQVVADLRWGLTGTWQDRNHWAPVGPGSKRGMNRLHGRDKKLRLSPKKFQAEFREYMDRLRKVLPPCLAEKMEAIDYQGVLCEFDKYERTRLYEGRTRGVYNGGVT